MYTNIDRLAQEQVPLLMSNGGNAAENMKYEALVHPTRKCESIIRVLRQLFRRKEPEQNPAESYNSGSLRINRVRGMDLVTGNFEIGNPYVIFSLGHQTKKTKVIKGSTDPVWNESLMLDIPDCILPLKLEVHDKFTFTWDDRMGDAEIDVRPLVQARELFKKEVQESGASEGNGGERRLLGIVPARRNNDLRRDSKMWLVQGRMIQEVKIRLKNAQMGYLEIELEYLPPTE